MKYLLVILLFILSGCISLSHDLGSGYILGYGTDDHDRIIYFKRSDGGSQVSFYEDTMKITRFFKNEEGIITSFVSQVAVNKKYILVDQKPIDSICDCDFTYFHNKYGDSDNIGYSQRCDNAIKKALIHYYYIIDKETNIILGPMSKEELVNEREKLGISKELDYKYHEY